jgi:hypothetical protein
MIVKSRTRTHADSYRVNAEVQARRDGRVVAPLSDSAALAIASWYASPMTGQAFAQLATTGEADSDALFGDITRAMRDRAGHGPDSVLELVALYAWVLSRPGMAGALTR